jgi:hypothetical protein
MNDEEMKSWLAESMPVTESLRVFSEDEMQGCVSCGRRNPPTRTKCLYCGVALDLHGANIDLIKFGDQTLESWEKGWNVIVMPSDRNSNDEIARQISEAFPLDLDFVQNVLNRDIPMPIARVSNEAEARIWAERLESFGSRSRVISDEDLEIDKRPIRIRAAKFGDQEVEFVDFNKNIGSRFVYPDIILVVSGSIFTTTAETLEKRKRGRSETVDEIEMMSDEPLVDIYSARDQIGYRVMSGGFDFSCLGDGKTRIAGENISKFAEQLIAACPNARLIDDYRKVHTQLDVVWGLERRQEFGGARRGGLLFAEREKKTIATNVSQFTRFSRLQRLVI